MIFLSHSWTNKRAVRQLVEALALESVPAWLDEQQLDGGESLRAALLEAIAKSNVYLYLVSAAANASGWVQDELKYAIGLDFEKRLKVIPVRLVGDDSALPSLLTGRLYRTLEITAGGPARLAHDLKKETGSDAVPEGCRLSATVRLLGTGLTHTLDEARRLSDRAKVEVLFLNESYDRIDALYWTLSETKSPLVQGDRRALEQAASIVADVHRGSRKSIDGLADLSRRYLSIQEDDPHRPYWESGYLTQMRVLLHRLSWNAEYLTRLRDATSIDSAFVERKDLPEPFDGHVCDFRDGTRLMGGVRVARHGHPFAGASPPMPWGFSSPFADMLEPEVGESVGYSVARRFLAGSLPSVEMLNPETLEYGLG